MTSCGDVAGLKAHIVEHEPLVEVLGAIAVEIAVVVRDLLTCFIHRRDGLRSDTYVVATCGIRAAISVLFGNALLHVRLEHVVGARREDALHPAFRSLRLLRRRTVVFHLLVEDGAIRGGEEFDPFFGEIAVHHHGIATRSQ